MAIPEELVKDAPSFPEFLAWLEKNRVEREKEEARWRAEHEKWQAAHEAQEAKRRAEYEAQQKKWQAEYEERQKKLDAILAKTSKTLGKLGNSIGELVEVLISARLWEKFPEYGFLEAARRLSVYDEKRQLKTEIDILLVNGEWAMAVEVKHTANTRAVEHHLGRMARILKYPPAALRSGVKLLGAIAGGIVQNDARDLAHEHGLFVLELAGESVVRFPEPEGFTPKVW